MRFGQKGKISIRETEERERGGGREGGRERERGREREEGGREGQTDRQTDAHREFLGSHLPKREQRKRCKGKILGKR